MYTPVSYCEIMLLKYQLCGWSLLHYPNMFRRTATNQSNATTENVC